MTFTATATIQSFEKLNDKFFKVLLQDERKQHIVVNVPVEKEHELEINGKVSIWGNVSAFNYQSKWYNNLFAQTVVPENKKFILVKRENEEKQVSFSIIEYKAEPFSEEHLNASYPEALSEEENYNKNKTFINEHGVSFTKIYQPLYSNLEYWHLQNSITHNRISVTGEKIILNENITFFMKNFGSPKHHKLYFTDRVASADISDFAP